MRLANKRVNIIIAQKERAVAPMMATPAATVVAKLSVMVARVMSSCFWNLPNSASVPALVA